MTKEDRELAITYLKEMQETYIEGDGYERHPLPEYYAIETALEALKQEPCEDAISKKAVLDLIEEAGKFFLCARIEELPPVQPKAKVGKWIRESRGVSHCSRCAQQIFSCQEWFKRCPNCEAKMESEE